MDKSLIAMGSARHRRVVTGRGVAFQTRPRCSRFAPLARRHAITGVQTPSCNTLWVTQGSRLRERRPFPGSLAAQVPAVLEIRSFVFKRWIRTLPREPPIGNRRPDGERNDETLPEDSHGTP
jgi:hypothetical protein